MIVLDTETEEIIGNPLINPPAVHGFSYIVPGYSPGYLHFRGERQNCKWSEAADFLNQIWNSEEPLLFHNAPFDLACLQASFLGLTMPHWSRIHDTMFLCYLADPHAPSLSLKPSCERYLGMAPDEQNALHDWIVANVSGANRKNAGAYVCMAPVELIAPYAIGDVVRTKALYDHLIDKVPAQAYSRERELMPILMEASVRGLRVDRTNLEADLGTAVQALEQAQNWVVQRLGVPGLNPSSSLELASALDHAGVLSAPRYTEKGARSVSKEVLMETVTDPEILAYLLYRSSLSTCVGTFMMPWLDMSAEDGRLHPEWNQVRNTEEGKRSGTRTGRLSCAKPNLQNPPTEFKHATPPELPPLPFMRKYLLPEEGHFWLKRDFSSQEIRILAHFEDGELLQAYRRNPGLDPHQSAREMIESMTGVNYPRKDVKITGFSIIYGSGVNGLATQLHRPAHEAAGIREAYLIATPGVGRLSRDIRSRSNAGLPITTWGGREYYKEPSKLIKGRMVDFGYKLLNYLIQGSAADQTKQCLIEWYNPDAGDLLLATVHDEINISAPMDEWELYMERLKEIMNRDRLDCPMQSEGFVGPNWHELEACS